MRSKMRPSLALVRQYMDSTIMRAQTNHILVNSDAGNWIKFNLQPLLKSASHLVDIVMNEMQSSAK